MLDDIPERYHIELSRAERALFERPLVDIKPHLTGLPDGPARWLEADGVPARLPSRHEREAGRAADVEEPARRLGKAPQLPEAAGEGVMPGRLLREVVLIHRRTVE